MACSCASAIDAELRDWVALGGGNSGCCGNAAHTYGFHLPAYAVPTSDYSRYHEAAVPYNMNWACAGDFGHSGNASLRARHAELLGRLMAGDPSLPMICEFIGQPWAGKPVYYWARWNGVQTLQRYTGSGHDTWSHISWWRSLAYERAYLWTAPGVVVPTPAVAPTPEVAKVAPKYPGYVMTYNPNRYDANVKIWQAQMRSRKWTITVDGYFGDGTLRVVTAFQREKNIPGGADGKIGTNTWTYAWSAPVT